MRTAWTIAALALGLSTASAADMRPVVKAPIAPPPVWSWTGFYIGGNAGYSWGESDTSVGYVTAPGGVAIVPPAGSATSASFDLNGWVGGGQLGYNWQTGPWVFGIEADIQATGQDGDAGFLCAAAGLAGGACLPGLTFLPPGVTGTSLALSQSLEWFGTLRGRLGWTATPSVLLYVTGGLAYGEIETSGTLTGATPAGVLTSTGFSHSKTNVGWTVGAGAEAHLGGNWTGKIEYLYLDLGDVSGTVSGLAAVPAVGIAANYTSDITDHILRVGINYKFF
ncbi:porin family protein [Xanthobacteraceae bacterium Astr-EGSB]|uniref:outer membrane protein n=1 Tax=Astrobacterium formosum TaxID=3069710 RepID=UPI0027B41FA4|nr:porin family protein [Xanthobacteraceae bacterium Astr-EGSB]